MLLAAAVILLVDEVAGHGYLFEPKSRQRQASERGVEYCPHVRTSCAASTNVIAIIKKQCVLAAPIGAQGNGAGGRSYPGNRAFAEPGTAPSVSLLMNGESPFGVCGTQMFDSNDYNYPDPSGKWGREIVATYKAGEAFEVSWCVNADHGGVYTFRLCDDSHIVSKFYGNAPLNASEQVEAEECFQRNELRCDAHGLNNDCSFEPYCRDGWGCAEEGRFFHCGQADGSYQCRNTNDRCNNGDYLVKRNVVIPVEWPEGPTIFTWRWDSHETTEVFAGCADIYVTAGDFQPSPSPTTAPPTVSPAPTAATTTAPTLKPTEAKGGKCCWWSGQDDWCAVGACPSGATEGTCAESYEACKRCSPNAVWCPNGGGSSYVPPSPAPVPLPTLKPTEERELADLNDPSHCCFFGTCGACAAPVFDDYYCGQSANCANCGGTYCETNET